MKYQYILNNILVFETDSTLDYCLYLQNKKDIMYSVLYNLLEKSNGYIANMAQAGFEEQLENHIDNFSGIR